MRTILDLDRFNRFVSGLSSKLHKKADVDNLSDIAFSGQYYDLKGQPDPLVVDNIPIADSDNLVKSGGVYTEFDKMNKALGDLNIKNFVSGSAIHVEDSANMPISNMIVYSKNLVSNFSMLYNSGSGKIVDGKIIQLIPDTGATNFWVALYEDQTQVSMIVLKNVTVTGKQSVKFKKSSFANKLNFGHNGKAVDLKAQIDISGLQNDTYYTLSVNYENVTQGSIVISEIMVSLSDDTTYVPYSQNVDVKVCGKNLFDNLFADYAQPKDYRILPISLEQGKTYKLKAELTGNLVSGTVLGVVPFGNEYHDFDTHLIACLNSDGSTKEQTITVDKTFTSPKLVAYCTDKNVWDNVFQNYHIQLEVGSIATSYDSYECQNATIDTKLQTGWEELKTYKGITNIIPSIDANIDCTYIADTNLYAQSANIINPQTWTDTQKSTARGNIGGVPYTGATNDLDMGTHNFKASGFSGAGVDGSLNILSQEVTNAGKNKYIGLLSTPTGLMMQNQTYTWNGTSYIASNGLFIGQNAGKNNTGNTCTGFGHQSLYSNTGSYCNAFGYAALYANTGVFCNGVGASSLQNNSGNDCNGVGYQSLYFNTGGLCNGVGHTSLQNNIGSNCNGLGYGALRYNQKDNNIVIGHNAYSTFLENSASDKAINSTAVDTTLNRVTVTNHGFGSSGTYVNIKYQATTGTPIGGILIGSIYQVKIIDANTIEFSTNGRGYSLTSQGTGTHTFRAQYAYGNTITIGNNMSPTKDNQCNIGDSSMTEFNFGGALVAGTNYIKIASQKTPASATDVGVSGQICYDSNYIYVCVADNTWKRIALTTW